MRPQSAGRGAKRPRRANGADSQISDLSSPFCKNILFYRIPKSAYIPLRPASTERGVSRSSRTLDAGCDGRGWRLKTSGAGADGKIVWS